MKPAFPISDMDLRDYFAAQALISEGSSEFPVDSYPRLAEYCYKIADAMMQERQREPEHVAMPRKLFDRLKTCLAQQDENELMCELVPWLLGDDDK